MHGNEIKLFHMQKDLNTTTHYKNATIIIRGPRVYQQLSHTNFYVLFGLMNKEGVSLLCDHENCFSILSIL